ncbi:MAG: pyrrolo-quinoline quinone [Terriglobales bacterium]
MRAHIRVGHVAMRRRPTDVHCAFQSQSRTAGRLVYHSLLMLVAWLLTAAHPAAAQLVSVTTYHNDNSRRGLNDKETILTHANVNPNQFGKLFSRKTDGYSYAQPLYLPGVNIPGLGVHNVLYVATEHDTIYAFDADSNQGINKQPLWQRTFIDPTHGITTVASQADAACTDLVPEIGITGTPVIDTQTGTMYVVVRTKENNQFFQRLHALDVASGAEKFGGPTVIKAKVKGSGDGAVNGFVHFDPLRNNQRAGLLLVNGLIYIAWASHCDNGAYHGWVISYDALTLKQNAVWNATPNAGLGGVWQGGGAPAADDDGNVYFATGNGGFDANTGGLDFGDSVIKTGLPMNGQLPVVDYFTPHDEQFLDDLDLDLGSGGPMLLPTQRPGSPHQHLLTVVGKGGVIYLIDRDNLGHFNPDNDDQIVQSLTTAVMPTGGIASWWNNTLYFVPVFDNLKAFHFDPKTGLISLTPESQTITSFDFPTALLSISSNGNKDGIVWAPQDDGYHRGAPAILRAYDARNLTHELYNSEENFARDDPGAAGKFTVPTIANGKVYFTTHKRLVVYGLLL